MSLKSRIRQLTLAITILLLFSGIAEAFENPPYVVLPENLTSLGSQAFAGVSKASDIYIPASVTNIGASPLDIGKFRIHCFYGGYAWNYFADNYPDYSENLIPWSGIKPTGRTVSSDADAIAAKNRAVSALFNRFESASGMELLLSYDTDNIYIKNTAFTYDNALAAMAFLSEGKPEAAARILDSFVHAVETDRYKPDRIRNAYMAGPVSPNEPVQTSGFWEDYWHEDQYQVGSNTGNTAYSALALLQYDRLYGNSTYRATAQTLMDRILAENTDAWYGFTAGYDGWPEPESNLVYELTYKSIEHNIDAYAVFTRLYAITGENKYSFAAQSALDLVTAMYDPGNSCFYVGTNNDGQTPNRGIVVLDAIVWNQMALGNAFRPYLSALDTLDSMRTSDGGYPFSKGNGLNGWWTEGTAFTMLMYHLLGAEETAAVSLDALLNIQNAGGLFPAASGDEIPTGLNWNYTSDLHIAPTAWFIMAVNGFNPYLFE